jgi:hypothetical protein
MSININSLIKDLKFLQTTLFISTNKSEFSININKKGDQYIIEPYMFQKLYCFKNNDNEINEIINEIGTPKSIMILDHNTDEEIKIL